MATADKVASLAHNVWIELVARAAMILAAPVAGWLVYLGMQWLDARFDQQARLIESIGSRVEALEIGGRRQSSQIQDHEARMQFGKSQREALTLEVRGQFDKFATKLELLGDKISDVNGNVIALRATLNERMPKRDANVAGP